MFKHPLVGLFTAVLLVLFELTTTTNAEEVEPHCSDIKRDEIELHLSTKTPYRAVANMDEHPFIYPGCHPLRVWSVVRHGTRNPSKEVIESAQDDLNRLKEQMIKKSNLCPEEIARLQYWNCNVTTEEEKFLVAEGEDEMIELAERMQKRFPELMPDIYNPNLYNFKYTKTQRTLRSAQSFATGLFGRQNIGEIRYPMALHKDPVLRFYKLCNRWKIDVDKNPQTFDNVRKFLDGPEMRDALAYIRQRTRIDDITPLDAQLIYTICAFETAWQRRRPPSVWCNLLDRHALRALEFAEDLEYYWNDGYGYELTHRIACPAVVDMFEHIDPNSHGPNATFYFTHSGTLLKLLAHLGLYKDAETLTYRDFAKQRAWRTSRIDAFATNVAFVLYECKQQEPMVLALHQERPVHIPGCPTDSELCGLRTLRGIFADSLSHCDFQEMCHK